MISVHWSTPGSQRGERHGMGVTTFGHQPALRVARPSTIGRSITGAFGSAPRRTATTDSFERVIASRGARFGGHPKRRALSSQARAFGAAADPVVHEGIAAR